MQVRYCVSFLGSLYESVVGPFSATMTVSNGSQQTLTGIPVADTSSSVRMRNIYRQIAGTQIAEESGYTIAFFLSSAVMVLAFCATLLVPARAPEGMRARVHTRVPA